MIRQSIKGVMRAIGPGPLRMLQMCSLYSKYAQQIQCPAVPMFMCSKTTYHVGPRGTTFKLPLNSDTNCVEAHAT